MQGYHENRGKRAKKRILPRNITFTFTQAVVREIAGA